MMSTLTAMLKLKNAGVKIARDGEDLDIRFKRGVDPALHLDAIRLNRLALLTVLGGEQQDTPWITLRDLPRIRAPRGDVETTTPPAGWDGSLPDTCGWPHLCKTLGPCHRHVAGGACRLDGGEAVWAEPPAA